MRIHCLQSQEELIEHPQYFPGDLSLTVVQVSHHHLGVHFTIAVYIFFALPDSSLSLLSNVFWCDCAFVLHAVDLWVDMIALCMGYVVMWRCPTFAGLAIHDSVGSSRILSVPWLVTRME